MRRIASTFHYFCGAFVLGLACCVAFPCFCRLSIIPARARTYIRSNLLSNSSCTAYRYPDSLNPSFLHSNPPKLHQTIKHLTLLSYTKRKLIPRPLKVLHKTQAIKCQHYTTGPIMENPAQAQYNTMVSGVSRNDGEYVV